MSPALTKIESGAAPAREVVVSSDVKQLCDTIKTVAAIAAIVVIEIAALRAGHNGILIGGTIGAITGLGGYQIAKKKFEVTI